MTTPLDKFNAAMRALPLVAILRGLSPAEAADVGDAIVEPGFLLLEVPLNSPRPLESIALMRQRFPQALVGAGTVLSAQQVRDVQAAGGELVVSPNFNAEVIAEAARLGMVCLPGVMTPTEAFGALAAGATGLKLFPAELASPAVVKALLATGASAKLITSRYDGTALIAAAHLGHDGVVRELIEAGAPLDHVNNLGWTALMEAVVLGDGGLRHVEAARALLAAGADRTIADRQGITPLQHARARGYVAMAELLETAPRR
jgi:2-dehydro-3-deoxyphosphogalactonate aldolase